MGELHAKIAKQTDNFYGKTFSLVIECECVGM